MIEWISCFSYAGVLFSGCKCRDRREFWRSPVAVPAFAVDQLQIGASIDVQMRALRAERHQRIGYERELLAANQACN
ncbi:hypothetical protein [Serratia aquatilis]|uniref:Uncharacterized protein n=1 Tax=Serratia aquatilis TaxID=1737515 RepID=A0ABV6EEH6_9GAMM